VFHGFSPVVVCNEKARWDQQACIVKWNYFKSGGAIYQI